MSFRNYVYISDRKVESLLPETEAEPAGRRTVEAGINLRIFGVRRSVETSMEADRKERLHRLVRYIADYGDLGSVDEPGQFFWGLMPLRWGPVRRNRPDLVYFGGRTERTVVGLGGSSSHVLGAPPEPAGGYQLPASLLPSLLEGLGDGPLADPGSDAADGSADERDHRHALTTVLEATAALRGPTQNLEFVATRELHGPVPRSVSGYPDGTMVLLGSPLYIAHVG